MDINLEKVINKIRRNSVTLWAGAGLSLYAGLPTGRKLADEIVKQMPKVYQDEFKGKALPEVAEEFVQMHSNSPLEAFSILNTYLNKEPQSIIYHEKLSEIPQIKNIVTTNYDDLFERAYGKSKLSVILENSHIPLANTPVKLYKIHGDMSHPESIVLTTSDYNDFFSFSHKNDSIWNKVTSLADETSFLFLGYSLEDPNVKT
ncbi:SIR2 family protein, partial [Priestia megaterium]